MIKREPISKSRAGWTRLAVLMAIPVAADEAYRFLMQLYLKGLGAPPFVIALGTSLCWLGIFVGSALWGAFSDQRSRRRILAFLLVGGSAMMLLLSTLPSTASTLVLVFLRVSLVSGIAPVVLAVQSRRSTLADRGRNLSILSAARAGGFAVGSLIAGFALETLGFRGTFALLSILPLFCLIALLGWEDGPPAQEKKPKRNPLRRLNGPLVCLYAGTVLRQMANTGTRSLIYVYMATLGLQTATMGALNSVNPAVQILAMLVFGHLADRIGRRRIFLLGFALSIVSTSMFALSTRTSGFAVAYALIGVAFPALFIGSTAHIGDYAPNDRQGEMIGLFESSRGLGGVVGPLLAGAVVPFVGYQGMIWVMAGCAALGFAIVVLGTRVRAPKSSGA